jgi:hypothetical protein
VAPEAATRYGTDLTPVIRALLICGSLAVAGCGGSTDELPRRPVTGTVTFDGKPLERGTIAFQPESGLPTAAAVPVNGGSYSVARQQGLVPGTYKVSVSSSAPTTAAVDPATGTPPPPGKPTPPPRELLPTRYNASTELSVEVKAEGSNSFDFTLTSRPPK